jgi:hypothetical protein
MLEVESKALHVSPSSKLYMSLPEPDHFISASTVTKSLDVTHA